MKLKRNLDRLVFQPIRQEDFKITEIEKQKMKIAFIEIDNYGNISHEIIDKDIFKQFTNYFVMTRIPSPSNNLRNWFERIIEEQIKYIFLSNYPDERLFEYRTTNNIDVNFIIYPYVFYPWLDHFNKIIPHLKPEDITITYNKFVTDSFNNLSNKFQTFQMPIAIDTCDFEKDINKITKKHNNNRLELVYCGRMRKEKGLDILIEALKYFKKDNNFYLHIISEITQKYDNESNKFDHDFLKYVQNKIVEYNLQNNIIFHGSLSNNQKGKNEILNESDILIHLSSDNGETYGRVITEAFASGVAVITTDWQALNELVEDNVNGFLVKVNHDKISPIEVLNCLNSLTDYEKLKTIKLNNVKKSKKYDYKKHMYNLRKKMISISNKAPYELKFAIKCNNNCDIKMNKNIGINSIIMNQEPINIVTAADNNYMLPLCIMLNSISSNTTRKIRFFILSNGISNENENEIFNLVKCANIELNFIDANNHIATKLPLSSSWDHITKTTYLRLFLPELIPNHIKKVIYLDGDIIVMDNISKLWEQELSGKTIGAVQDFIPFINLQGSKIDYSKLGIDDYSKNFNAGVLLIDLRKWNENKITEKACEFLEKYQKEIRFNDQEALNYIFADNWKELDREWNTFSLVKSHSPKIIHYITQNKPWMPKYNHYYLKEYHDAIKKTLNSLKDKNIIVDEIIDLEFNMQSMNCKNISVIIPTYNQKNKLKYVIQSLLDQKYSNSKYEIIIADDGSNDGTKNVVSNIKKRSSVPIKYICQEDEGFRAGKARNLGASIASHEYLVFLDNDIISNPNLLRNYSFAFETDNCVLGYTSGYNSQEEHRFVNIISDTENLKIQDIQVIPEFRHKYFVQDEKKQMLNKDIWHNFVSNNFGIRKDIFMQNKFDEEFIGWGVEDEELGYRLTLNGIVPKFNKNCIGYHISHEEHNADKIYSQEKVKTLFKNLVIFFRKYNDPIIKKYMWERFDNLPILFKTPNLKSNIEKMLNESIFLRTSNKCNNNCFFCTLYNKKSKQNKSIDEIKVELNHIYSQNSKEVIFSCNTDLRKDIFEILEYSKSLGFKVILETNGRMFSINNFTKKISGLVDKLIILPYNEDKDNQTLITRTKNSFEQMNQGILNIKLYKIPYKIKQII